MFSWLNRLRYSEFWATSVAQRARGKHGKARTAASTHLDGVNDARLQVQEQRAGHVVLVVSLVEEHVFPVASALRGVLLQHAVFADAVLQAKLRGAGGD